MEKQTFDIYCVSLFYESHYTELHLPFHLDRLDGREARSEKVVLDTAARRLSCMGREFNFVAMGVGHEGTCIAIHTTASHANGIQVKFYTRIPTPGTSAQKALEHSANNIERGLVWKHFPFRGLP